MPRCSCCSLPHATPIELGLAGREAELVLRFLAADDYLRRFREAFPEERGRIGIDTIVKAIAAFERTLLSTRSAYDDFWYRKRLVFHNNGLYNLDGEGASSSPIRSTPTHSPAPEGNH